MWYVCAALFLFHHQKSAMAYRAAVVEYSPKTGHTPEDTIRQNLRQYRLFIEKASNQSADIVVFPEYGLTDMVEDPEGYAIDIAGTTPLVQTLSAWAQQQRIYLVVNLLEKTSGQKTNYYNTNLVFDRRGHIIVKYHKINLFGEPNLVAGSPDQNSTFTTDFGATFATFTCADILHRNPSRTVLEDGRVTDIAFPTAWFSTLPFYHSLSVQHGYASSARVNLLAANLGDPEDTHGGSGIYSADGQAEIHITDVPKSELLTQNVGTVLQESNLSNYRTLRDFQAQDYKFKNVDLGLKNQTKLICHESFCCTFEIVVADQERSSDNYKIMAFDGVVPLNQSTVHIHVCSLLMCQNGSNESCGFRIKPATKFTSLRVGGNFEKSTTFYNPMTLDFDLRPMTKSVFSNRNDTSGSISVELSTVEDSQDVLVFGLFGIVD